MKKAGIIAGATLAGLLAMAPLALADEDGSSGIVNGANDNNVSVPVQACNNNLNGLGLQATDLTGVLGGGGAPANGDTCTQPSNAGDGS